MNDWQSTYLGRGALPRDLSGFEIEAFFKYSESERRVLDDEHHDVTEAQRRALVRAINAELSRTSDRQRLLQFARRWLYDHKQIPRERELRGYIAKAIREHDGTLVSEIIEAIDPDLLAQWKRTITQPREDGASPAGHRRWRPLCANQCPIRAVSCPQYIPYGRTLFPSMPASI